MKKIILSLTLLLFLVKSFSQTPALTKDEYLQKSKNQKTTAWVLLAGGTTMAVVGAIIGGKDDPGTLYGPSFNTGMWLFVPGVVADLVSIPFFISSAKNRGRAETISFNNQKILFPQQHTFVLKTQPTLILKIGL